MQRNKDSVFLIVGQGEMLEQIKIFFKRTELQDRLFCVGPRQERELIAAYHAMDVFVFASHSETQGLVLLEAMASGVPVVGVDAPGVRDVVRDRQNGVLVRKDDKQLFADALNWIYSRSPSERVSLTETAKSTAVRFDMSTSAEKALAVYAQICRRGCRPGALRESGWRENIHLIAAQVKLAKTLARATSAVISG